MDDTKCDGDVIEVEFVDAVKSDGDVTEAEFVNDIKKLLYER